MESKPSKRVNLILAVVLIIALAVFSILALNKQNPDNSIKVPDANSQTLVNTKWRLESYFNDSKETKIPNEVSITSSFDESNISGNGGCNSYSGKYTDSDGKLTISETSSTAMYCEPGGTYESGFFNALNNASTYEISDQSLTIFDSDKNAILKYKSLNE